MTACLLSAAASTGVGFKSRHLDDLLGGSDCVGWVEIHAENYLVAGGPRHRELEAVRAHCPLSIHAVGTSLLSAQPADAAQLARIGELVRRYQPFLVSEHLAWSAWNGHSFNDLLPAPYTAESLALVIDNVQRLQDAVQRQILIENPSLYLLPAGSEMGEAEFLNELCRRSGCGLLLDINNVVVSAANLGCSAAPYLAAIDPHHVGQIHLAGHAIERNAGQSLRIDDHGSEVADGTWDLFRHWTAEHGPRPSLIEWDTDVPDFRVLESEAAKAASVLATMEALHAA